MQTNLSGGQNHQAARPSRPSPLEIRGALPAAYREILTPEALELVRTLAVRYEPTRRRLLAARQERQRELDRGVLPDFLEETKAVREGDWRVAPIPADLQQRRVEITGPVDRKMIINALNSGADVFMADLEDSNSPTWDNVIGGQINLRDAVRGTISFTAASGKHYQLDEKPAVLMVRPRGWHLVEKHVLLDGEPISASLLDFGLYFFHNAKQLLASGSGPYFYLPKLENHLEARLWNDVFRTAQQQLGIRHGSIRATVLIETIVAAFEMDEILYELRDHSAGLNCGRWDYIFSYIKKLHASSFILPNRSEVTMTRHNMRSYSLLAIKTCHRRFIHAIGGMAAQIPIKNDPAANQVALDKVRDDKIREAQDGHDGTWVAHPALVSLAREQFDAHMAGPNQIDKLLTDVVVSPEDLLEVPSGAITEQGIVHNVDVAIQYMAAWLCGHGCVPIYNLMEDAATAEISRSQLWQWLHDPLARLDDGRAITVELIEQIIAGELANILTRVGAEQFEQGRFELAARLIKDIVLDDELAEFMTSVGYEHLD